MPTPSKVKTWQYNVNQTLTAAGTQLAHNQKNLRAIKTSLVGFGTLPWVVRYSCDSVTAGTPGDLVDRWTADANLVWAAGAHSWIVLRQTGIASTFEIVIDLPTSTSNDVTVLGSFNAFSGGTTTARPTATNEFSIRTGTWGYTSGPAQTVLSVMQSDDGECTRVFQYRAGSSPMLWILDKLQNPVTGWSTNFAGVIQGSTVAVGTIANLGLISSGPLRGTHGAIAIADAKMTGEGYRGQLVQQRQTAANSISSEFPMSPIGFASDTVRAKGRHGNFFDLYWGLATVIGDGDTYPVADEEWIQVGQVIHPWDGSVPVLT